jgi:DNA-binding MarR family transcriptional regulator
MEKQEISLKKLIGQTAHWTINKDLVRKIGLTETLVLQQIVDLNYVFKKKEIFQSIGDMAAELGITEYSIKSAIAKLKSLNLIGVQRKSVGFRNFYSVNFNSIKELMDSESFDEFIKCNKTSDNTSSELKVRLGNETIILNSELKYDMGELNSTHQISEVIPTFGEMKTTHSDVEINSLSVENDIAITNNTSNNTKKNTSTNNTVHSTPGSEKLFVSRNDSVYLNNNVTTEELNSLYSLL